MNEPEPPSPPPRRDSSRPPAQDHYLLGIGLLLVVVALWVGSSFLMSSMFRDEQWNRPWLVTYICTSSFTLYLIRPGFSYLRSHGLSTAPNPSELKGNNTPAYCRHNGHPDQAAYTLVDDQDREPSQSTVTRPACVTRAFAVPESPLTTKEIAHLAATFVLLWFAANWSVNAALGYTSVSSTTILSSLSGFFTLAIGVATGAERFSLGRLLAVATSIAGVVLVSKSDRNSSDQNPSSSHWILGDILALSSAALYALYVILMKVKVKEESRVDMQLFFGFVGAINLLCFWPIGVILHYADIEPFSLPHTHKLWLSVLINAMCTFVSDYIYMLAMLKTSPLVVTLGISLTLPVAVVGDIFKGEGLPAGSLIGAGLVLSSFVILSLVENQR
ncbi:hypothetical protein PCASD_08757 [Puccinia coronata f. sp. avenae]|uniref:EamA domain-containing protein n=1 Tax=Puccinia coronata f. sp. avenae TaxID=200324 RepID=A0A2N5TE54_9BASI|nr:hypothetical protein PCASD_08757 [Puccinia coronata f. sp. avenae]